ncbi:MAG TPA: hypothetical protein VIK53_10405 [Verrucomicrobiae bacterium]
MKNFTKTLVLAACALAVAGVVRAEDSVVGKWKAEFDSQIGTQKYTYEFKLDGTNLVGRAIGERDNGSNDVAVTDLKVDKDKISFGEPLKIQDNDVTVEYSGTIAGDEMKLHRKVGDFAEYDIVAKRAKDSVAGKWEGQFDSQIGVQKYTYEFKVDGTNLTGTAVGISDNGTNSSTISEGKIVQDTISFVEPLSFGGNDIRIEYTGKVAGDEIKLHRKVGDFAEEDLVVKRASAGNAQP